MKVFAVVTDDCGVSRGTAREEKHAMLASWGQSCAVEELLPSGREGACNGKSRDGGNGLKYDRWSSTVTSAHLVRKALMRFYLVPDTNSERLQGGLQTFPSRALVLRKINAATVQDQFYWIKDDFPLPSR